MTAEIINLRQARKQRERAAREAEAGANRAKFGRTRAERERDEQVETQARQHLDAHRREPAGEEPPHPTPGARPPKTP